MNKAFSFFFLFFLLPVLSSYMFSNRFLKKTYDIGREIGKNVENKEINSSEIDVEVYNGYTAREKVGWGNVGKAPEGYRT
ncbi:hypothetical protein [Methanosarcina sp.]|uniref:hypothetical protein n=1 Tax=Methanosarcina sp. TaxID=2213 RepID=UPI003C790A45